MTNIHWTRLAFVLSGFFGATGSVFVAQGADWHKLFTPAGLGGLVIAWSVWLGTLSTNGGILNIEAINEATK
jgi:hypothetical protein